MIERATVWPVSLAGARCGPRCKRNALADGGADRCRRAVLGAGLLRYRRSLKVKPESERPGRGQLSSNARAGRASFYHSHVRQRAPVVLVFASPGKRAARDGPIKSTLQLLDSRSFLSWSLRMTADSVWSQYARWLHRALSARRSRRTPAQSRPPPARAWSGTFGERDPASRRGPATR
jgi:hypothetical protein